jgi:hypothetical protein
LGRMTIDDACTPVARLVALGRWQVLQLRALLPMGARRGVGGGKEAFPRRSCGAPQGTSRIGVCSSLGQAPARPWADWSGFGQPLDKPWATPQATPRADLGQAIGVWRRQRGCISAQVLPANCERRREGLEASCKARCSGVASRHPANGALPVAYIDELRRQLIASRVCFE